MIFLARYILKGPSQAALVAATMAMLGMLLLPMVIISSAAIALVTLARGYRQGMVVMALAAAGAVLFSLVLFSSPMAVVYFILLAWLPAWMAATVLRQTVSLSSSLLLVTALSLIAVVVLYAFFPGIGEFAREPLDALVQELAKQYQGQISLEELRQAEAVVIGMVPGLIASIIQLGAVLSLLLARWWQALVMNPGGFASEFQALKLGRMAALVALATIAAAALVGSQPLYAAVFVVVALYQVQGLALMHAIVALRKLNTVWLYVVYVLMLFIPEIMVLLVIVGLADAWLDFRRRLAAV